METWATERKSRFRSGPESLIAGDEGDVGVEAELRDEGIGETGAAGEARRLCERIFRGVRGSGFGRVWTVWRPCDGAGGEVLGRCE